MSKYDSHLKCSFCGKSQEQVRKLIAGPGVYICDECVELCNEILDEELLEAFPTDRNDNTLWLKLQNRYSLEMIEISALKNKTCLESNRGSYYSLENYI